MDNLCLIGLDPAEMHWLRLLIGLLRHADPVVREIAKEALRYAEGAAHRSGDMRAAS